MTFTHALATNNYGEAKFIVDASAANGTHTTIASALTSASSGDTIFIRPGTYTENLTLKAGVNLCAYGPSMTFAQNSTTIPNVIIKGKCTFTAAGTVGIDGISLETNSDFCLAVTGTLASVVILNKCFINALNNTGISFTSSSASSAIQLNYCGGDIGTTGIAIFAHSGAGTLRFIYTFMYNSGSSTTVNTVSGTGSFFPNYSSWANGTTLSSTCSMGGSYNNLGMVGNQTALTVNSTVGINGINLQYCEFASNTASAMSIGSGASIQLHNCFFSSSNATTITGTGTLAFTNLTFNSVSSLDAALTLSNSAMNSFISGAGVGTSGQALTSNGATSPPTWQATSGGGGTLATQQATTSGTEFNFPGIPAGTKTIYVMLDGVSLDGTDEMMVQIGDAGGIENTGYAGSVSQTGTVVAFSAGFQLTVAQAAANTYRIVLTLTLMDAATFKWAATSQSASSDTGVPISMGAGIKSLSAQLTQLTLTRTGTNNFDAGSVNILYYP